jgi:CoA:oxalate CoA-transferase
MLLADMGAEVIRVEPIGGGVDRTWAILGPDGETLTFKILGRNKKCITLNLSTERGKAIFHDLVKNSDVVLHNFPPGTTLASELSYEKLRKVKPSIIVSALSGYGLDGPDAEEICFDFVTQARAGAMVLNGFPGSPPLKTTVPYVDCSSGIANALGIMLALYHREKTGEGQFVGTALFDMASYITQHAGALIYFTVYGETRTQVGNCGFGSYMNCLKAKDGWVMFVTASNDIWKRFTKAIGKEELNDDPRFKNDMVRALNAPLIDPIVQEWADEKTSDEIMKTLQAARVACARVNTADRLLNDPQSVASGMVVHVNYPDIGEVPIPGVPVKLSRTPGSIRSLAPKLGEHNEEIYSGLLGLNGTELSQLRKEKII